MKKKPNLRQQRKLGISLRAVLAFTGIAVMTAGAGFYFLFMFQKPGSSSAAGDTMILSDIRISQEPRELFRGTNNNIILKIEVETKGSRNPLEIRAFRFNTRGTSKPAGKHIRSARLWCTGGTETFIPMGAFGISASADDIDDLDFEFTGMKKLSEGSNFFWLTFDIPNNEHKPLTVVDAECSSIQIGSIDYRPDFGSPQGAFKLHGYRSWFAVKDGDISDISCWNSKRDGSGSTVEFIDPEHGSYIIPSGRVMHNKLGANIPYIQVENRARLFSSSELRCRSVRVLSQGIFRIDEHNSHVTRSRIVLEDNATYIHNSGNRIPENLKPSENSTVWVTRKPSSGKINEGHLQGNLTLDFKDTEPFDIGSICNTVTGNLIIRSGSKSAFIHYSGKRPFEVLNNFVIDGGTFVCSDNDTLTEIHIRGNMIINAGNLYNAVTPAAKGSSNIRITGDVVISENANIQLAGKFTNPVNLILENKASALWTQETEKISLGNITITENSSLTLSNGFFGNISEGCTLLVSPSAQLDCGNTVVEGPGTVILMNGAEIGIGKQEGLNSTGSRGNIQTGKLIVDPGSSVTYNGNMPLQSTGNFITMGNIPVIRNLNIELANDKAFLVLDNNFQVTGRLNLISGTLVQNDFRIDLSEPRASAAE